MNKNPIGKLMVSEIPKTNTYPVSVLFHCFWRTDLAKTHVLSFHSRANLNLDPFDLLHPKQLLHHFLSLGVVLVPLTNAIFHLELDVSL